jgi:hypothetical protein
MRCPGPLSPHGHLLMCPHGASRQAPRAPDPSSHPRWLGDPVAAQPLILLYVHGPPTSLQFTAGVLSLHVVCVMYHLYVVGREPLVATTCSWSRAVWAQVCPARGRATRNTASTAPPQLAPPGEQANRQRRRPAKGRSQRVIGRADAQVWREPARRRAETRGGYLGDRRAERARW